MKERPILFSAPMVRAILAGTKTQTRRAITHPLLANLSFHVDCGDGWWGDEEGHQARCPYGQPGDQLWVRETFAHIYRDNSEPDERRDDDIAYKADHCGLDEYAYGSWKPSIHMPRWASRITLEVTGVRVERLQDISEADALAEGVERTVTNDGWRRYCTDPEQEAAGLTPCATACDAYRSLWESINGFGIWDANPWVWVVEFKRLEGAA